MTHFSNFLKNFAFFYILKIGIVASFWRQRIGSEDINIKNFGKISIKFAIVFKCFENSCHFFCVYRSLRAGEKYLGCLADGILDSFERQNDGFE